MASGAVCVAVGSLCNGSLCGGGQFVWQWAVCVAVGSLVVGSLAASGQFVWRVGGGGRGSLCGEWVGGGGGASYSTRLTYATHMAHLMNDALTIHTCHVSGTCSLERPYLKSDFRARVRIFKSAYPKRTPPNQKDPPDVGGAQQLANVGT